MRRNVILLRDLLAVGHVNKPHGISGELSITFDADIIPEVGTCLIVPVNGLLTPFFVESVRPRGNADTWLIRIDGIDSDSEAKTFTGKEVYMRKADIPTTDYDTDDEGFYAEDLIGYTAKADSASIGIITDIDDRTSNWLFIVSPSGGGDDLLIPVTDDFIADINTDTQTITFNLPHGLIEK